MTECNCETILSGNAGLSCKLGEYKQYIIGAAVGAAIILALSNLKGGKKK